VAYLLLRGKYQTVVTQIAQTETRPTMPRRNNNQHDNSTQSGWEASLKRELANQWEQRYGYRREPARGNQRPSFNRVRTTHNRTEGTA
jgi:hypothetical protein